MERKLYSFLYRLAMRMALNIPVIDDIKMANQKLTSFLRVWRYLSLGKISGDYLEFGVLEGMSFELSLRAAAKNYSKTSPDSPRFFAFDSFEGLPVTDNQDAPAFQQGDLRGSKHRFQKNIRKAAKGWDVIIIEGFYDETLTAALLKEHHLSKAAFVNIDCDLYSSTLQALNFVTPLLQTGSILFFDDWHFSHGDPNLGETGACSKWLENHPNIGLIDYGNVGTMGKLFIVNVDSEKDLSHHNRVS